ncbi:MAG: hypothetical protein PQJ61_07430 [Spirochaetales bacterium]|uniref:PKD domain-containing protein n=1 Tax=Candidatus Thalassospirochaeta sargassi TaxID=3119039 RepID=A0AAJ1II11_9SPIO|nr:hypothetical protein [Spirochaetales bacterium]
MKNKLVFTTIILIAVISIYGCSDMLTEDPNRPPSISLGEDVFVLYPGVEQELDISESFDVDEQSLSYSWSVFDAPDDAVYTLSGEDQPVATFSAETVGDYYLTANVSDEYDEDDVSVLFITVTHDAPVAVGGSGADLYPGISYTLSGSASDDDPDGASSLTYLWTVTPPDPSAEYTLTGETSLTPTFVTGFIADGDTDYSTVPDYLGSYTLTLTVIDEWGLTDTDDVVIEVSNDNPAADIATFASPAAGGTVNLDGSASEDTDNARRQTEDLRYVWSVTDSPVGSTWEWNTEGDGTDSSFDTANIDNVDFTPTDAGVYTLRLTVYDEYGASGSQSVIFGTTGNTAPSLWVAGGIVSSSDTRQGDGTGGNGYSDDDTSGSDDDNDGFTIDASLAINNAENDTLEYSWLFDDFAGTIELMVEGATQTLSPGQAISTGEDSILTIAPTLSSYPDDADDFTITITVTDGIETDSLEIYFDLF